MDAIGDSEGSSCSSSGCDGGAKLEAGSAAAAAATTSSSWRSARRRRPRGRRAQRPRPTRMARATRRVTRRRAAAPRCARRPRRGGPGLAAKENAALKEKPAPGRRRRPGQGLLYKQRIYEEEASASFDAGLPRRRARRSRRRSWRFRRRRDQPSRWWHSRLAAVPPVHPRPLHTVVATATQRTSFFGWR